MQLQSMTVLNRVDVAPGLYDASDSKRFFLGANYVLTDKASGAITDSIYVLATSSSSGLLPANQSTCDRTLSQ